MKLGKEEEKRMDPLFPRLHINDADKGGPRAPPRNKMALCEHSSVTLSPQRFTSTSAPAPAPGSMSMLPLLPNSSNSIPAPSSSLVGCNKKSLFSLSHNSSESPHFIDILHPYSSGGANFTMGRPDVRPLKPLNPQVSSLKGNLPSTSQCNLLQPHSLSYSNSNPSAKRFGRESDFCGPKLAASGKPLNNGNIPKSAEKEKLVISSYKPSLTGGMQLKFREHSINQAGDLAQCQKRELCAKLPAPHLSTRDKSVVHRASSLVHTELNIKSFVSSTPENRCGQVVDLDRCSDSNSESDEDCWDLHKRKAAADVTYSKHEDDTTKRCASIMEGPSCSFIPREENHRSPKRVKSSSDCPEGHISGTPEVGDTDRSEGISETCSLNSRLVEKVCPDNVIALIGQELFWKARRTIVHQQRIFAIQLFELHRLTKVQKLIARSPDILFKGNFYLHQPSIKFSSLKKLPCDNVLEPPALAVEPKVSPKLNNSEHPADNNAYEKLLPLHKDNDKKLIPQHSSQKPNVGTPTSRSFVSDPKLPPRCFQPPPGYQWLVPIRSPSEGLVYKPYTGPSPPPPGFMAPVYGSCRPVTLSPISGDFSNVPYSVPTSHKQGVGIFPGTAILDQSCIQPYPMPVIKPSASSSAVEKMNPFPGIRSSERENSPSMHDVNVVRPHKKSCNVSCQKSSGMSECDGTFQADRGSDMQGSSASSPSERVQRDALSLFPITPTANCLDQPVKDNNTEQRIQVIKVVPHNPKSASESAARIFRSIQEERKLNS
ncbi:ELF3-like protein 2 [Nicotiana tabacum]|uniref:ELF3-like protein 2 n=1 Tax=Nicotiana tabacum TaxID=4097 RepID=A0A1S3ZCY1_TOBAC|nr:PREDICTED: protein EARLY FLOWERING 3-like [Nicotiana tabacum]